MTLRFLAAGAALTLLAGPPLAGSAWADCAADIEALEPAVVTAETGAAPPSSELPATEHQAEVLEGSEAGDAPAVDAAREAGIPASEHQQEVLSGDEPPVETAAGPSGDVEAASPHQREATREVYDDETKAQASSLLAEARDLAAAGDEAGCQDKLTEAKQLIGTQ